MPALADLLAVPGFAPLCLSNALSHAFGMRMQGIALAWLVLEMTDSKLWLGVINGLPALSIVLFSLVAGVLADSHDARRTLIAARAGLAVASGGTAFLVTAGQVGVGYLLIYALVMIGLGAVDIPVSRTLLHDVVGSARLLGAGATQSIASSLVNIVAPLGAGVLIAAAGGASAFGILTGGYLVAALILPRIDDGAPRPPRVSRPLADVVAGFAYVRATPTVAALVGLGFLVILAGVYFAMVPVFARDVLNVGAAGMGALVASFSVGSLAASAYLAANGCMRRRGAAVALLSIVFGAGMVIFALSDSFLMSCGVSLVMGVTAGFWQNLMSAMVQIAAAPEMRGRVVALFSMGFQLVGLGWLIGGTMAAITGPTAAVAVAGVAFAGLSTLIFAICKEVREID